MRDKKVRVVSPVSAAKSKSPGATWGFLGEEKKQSRWPLFSAQRKARESGDEDDGPPTDAAAPPTACQVTLDAVDALLVEAERRGGAVEVTERPGARGDLNKLVLALG